MQTINEIQQVYSPPLFEIGNDLEISSVNKWTKDEYYRLSDLGFFEGKRTELIEGEIIETPTMNSPHATAIRKVNVQLLKVFSENYVVDSQMPMDFGEDTELVPDIAVIQGKIEDFTSGHPQFADIIVEVADTTLRQDRTRKLKIYSKKGIPEYWIVNLKHRCLEVFRRPSDEFYLEVAVFMETDEISPLTKPETKIKVADLLP